MKGFFAQRRRKGHLTTVSETVRSTASQSTDFEIRPISSPPSPPPQNVRIDTTNPIKPPRPQRVGTTYSFPPPPPLWDRPQSPEQWNGSRQVVLAEPSMMNTSHPAFTQQQYDERASINDAVGDRLSEIISLIDEDAYIGSNPDFIISLPSPGHPSYERTPGTADSDKTLVNFAGLQSRYQSKTNAYQHPNRVERTVNWLGKVSYYANSRLPPGLPPLRVYIPTWPLFCLAAQYSSTAYSAPGASDWSDRSSCYIPADSSTGSKAMIIKSVPCDSKKVIVFAIRGTSVLSLRDWNTNLNTTPTSPIGFLDDAGNVCHAGFLRVAKAMIQPIAARLRQLLSQNPSRSECSLLITGHSAGGAVASLIFTHMLSQAVKSDLTILTSCFKRVHCVTFGAPPVSLLPLSKPLTNQKRQEKFLFYSFINEGDPVARAEKSYIRSLVDLVVTQLPTSNKGNDAMDMVTAGLGKLDLNLMLNRPKMNPINPQLEQSLNHLIPVTEEEQPSPYGYPNTQAPIWALPPSTLSNAGRLIVLRIAPVPYSPRQGSPEIKSPGLGTNANLRHEFDTVHAEIVADNQLHGVVFGDPLMHGMDIYRRRVEALAMKAVTGRAMDP